MPVKKISVSLPAELVDEARCQAGKAGLSAFIAAAVENELRSYRMKQFLKELDEEWRASLRPNPAGAAASVSAKRGRE